VWGDELCLSQALAVLRDAEDTKISGTTRKALLEEWGKFLRCALNLVRIVRQSTRKPEASFFIDVLCMSCRFPFDVHPFCHDLPTWPRSEIFVCKFGSMLNETRIAKLVNSLRS
jgi:hypothetical protein